ncbi:hypothetical protein LMG7974_01239 [Campylobacter majalis]|uniref:Uncharacterized protein n=1 Tax=Campylobacter majalis TaxID=2790656 RepID=A0ABN7K8S7_9BACT|nr:hypothetical protein [Campylobacter majalis]CAD7288928.1 hypothetical protein LMG7974_01239 [Campylobacter majalis]
MDYNKEDKGFVCFMYRLSNNRIVYVAFAFAVAVLALVLNTFFYCDSNSFILVMASFFMITLAPIFITVNPKKFILKLLGLLSALACFLVLLHNLNKLNSVTQSNIFGIYFYICLVLAGLCLLMLLSWFVYNARSSEVNKI